MIHDEDVRILLICELRRISNDVLQVDAFEAVRRGHVRLLKGLIETGHAKIMDRDAHNATLLHWAAGGAQVGICRYLLEQGAENNALGGDLLSTPLQWATGHAEAPFAIPFLIEQDAYPTIKDTKGRNTLHYLMRCWSVMSLLPILHQPIDVDAWEAQERTPLILAAVAGDALFVDILLHHGADSNAQDIRGFSPLHCAVTDGNIDCIQKLAEQNADLVAKDKIGRTPET